MTIKNLKIRIKELEELYGDIDDAQVLYVSSDGFPPISKIFYDDITINNCKVNAVTFE